MFRMDDHVNEAVQPEETARSAVRRVMSGLYPSVTTSKNETGDGSATGSAMYDPEPEHMGAPGWVHGGLSATVLDFVSARIANEALDSRVATGTLELRYRQPLLIDAGPFEVVGWTEEPRSRTVSVHTKILSNDGRSLVEATGLFVAVTRD